MPSILKMLPLIARQNFGRQLLERTPEPKAITSSAENVAQYDRVMETKLAISYAVAIDTIYRAKKNPFGGRALDLACGPGHLSITMAKELKLDEVVGVDLSTPMVAVASNNAVEQRMKNVSFQTGDATDLNRFRDREFDLSTMMDAAHHMPTLDGVAKVLKEMDRVTKADGLLVMMDLVRLRTRKLTLDYVNLLASDYVERGLPDFLADFRNSMFAAWTPDELLPTIPSPSNRRWSLVVPRGLPFAQFLIGYPRDRQGVFHARTPLWKGQHPPVSSQDIADFKMAKLTMKFASIATVG